MSVFLQSDTEDSGNSQVLCEDEERVFFRTLRPGLDGSGGSVLAARLKSDSPSLASLDRLTHEYALRDELENSWAVRPLELLHDQGRHMRVFEDPSGEPLDHLVGAPMEVESFLRVGIGIAAALAKLHQRGLIHKDLKPSHILVNCADGRVRLTAFGIASRLPRERQAPEPPEVIAGTLAYMSPEQTGRLNRSIDSRSDLYSVGVILYQMVTGLLPFTAADPLEWVHCHVARQPLAPAELLKSIPGAISAIITKLLAMPAEERYQSAVGLESELQRCLTAWESERRIGDFVLGQHDIPDRLLISEKLYGRARAVRALLSAFERIAKGGRPGVGVVSGYSGIGKSSVVGELHKELAPSRGMFASGKFDQYKRDIPYATLVQCFRSLVRSLLYKSDVELASWRAALVEALAPNGQLMVGAHVAHWTWHVRIGQDWMRRAFEVANNSGDLIFVAYGYSNLNANLLAAGDPLNEVQREAESGVAFAEKMRFGIIIDIIATQLALIRTLRGLTPVFGVFDNEQFSELQIERRYSKHRRLPSIECRYWIRKQQARFLAGDYDAPIDAGSRARRLLETPLSQIDTAEYHFYGALSHAAACGTAPDKRQHTEALAAHHRQIQAWAGHCRETFENQASLVSAEIARSAWRPIVGDR